VHLLVPFDRAEATSEMFALASPLWPMSRMD
jgi:hypothetical protein